MSPAHALLDPTVVDVVEVAASRHAGHEWKRQSFTDLNDRASHPCGIFHGGAFSVFAKLSADVDAHDQFAAEVSGATVLRERGEILTPTPIGDGVIDLDHSSLLLLEAFAERPPESRTRGDWRSIGQTLAMLHRVSDVRFGLELFDGYFGPLHQDNRPVSSNRWSDFYVERRLVPHLRLAVDSGNLPGELASAVDRLVPRLPSLSGPEPHPSLIHGDAQQNNFVSAEEGAIVVDAAPYFGHPELDLALLDYFAPVPNDVFDAYREITPIDPGFADRRELWRLFAYLAVIAVDGANPFGRQFVARVANAVALYT